MPEIDDDSVRHKAIDQILERAEIDQSDADYPYFFTLMLAAERLAKTLVLGIVASLDDESDRNRDRLQHQLARADGIGDCRRVLEGALLGPSS